jgi:hypothetical protein
VTYGLSDSQAIHGQGDCPSIVGAGEDRWSKEIVAVAHFIRRSNREHAADIYIYRTAQIPIEYGDICTSSLVLVWADEDSGSGWPAGSILAALVETGRCTPTWEVQRLAPEAEVIAAGSEVAIIVPCMARS